jgi:hypothetical protein
MDHAPVDFLSIINVLADQVDIQNPQPPGTLVRQSK